MLQPYFQTGYMNGIRNCKQNLGPYFFFKHHFRIFAPIYDILNPTLRSRYYQKPQGYRMKLVHFILEKIELDL